MSPSTRRTGAQCPTVSWGCCRDTGIVEKRRGHEGAHRERAPMRVSHPRIVLSETQGPEGEGRSVLGAVLSLGKVRALMCCLSQTASLGGGYSSQGSWVILREWVLSG